MTFEQGVSWHESNYRVWIHSDKRVWHDKNIQAEILMFVKNIVLPKNWFVDGNDWEFPKHNTEK